MRPLDPDRVDTVVVHVTDSSFGNVDTIDKWHKENGWNMIGYHFLITNCFPTVQDLRDKSPDIFSDGAIHEARPEEFQGAHVKGHNWHTIGIALVGQSANKKYNYGAMFTSKQLVSAAELIFDLEERFPMIRTVKGHHELDPGKGCPEIDMAHFRSILSEIRNGP